MPSIRLDVAPVIADIAHMKAKGTEPSPPVFLWGKGGRSDLRRNLCDTKPLSRHPGSSRDGDIELDRNWVALTRPYVLPPLPLNFGHRRRTLDLTYFHCLAITQVLAYPEGDV